MTTTSVKIVLDLATGTEEKAGTVATIADVLSQCDLTDMSTGLGVAQKWATFEPDEWLLDGNYKIMPESAHVGIISDSISGGTNGDFVTSPELTITFDGDYDLVGGLTLKFNNVTGDYCDDVDIEFYDSGDSLIDSDSYTPDSTEFFCELPATPLEDVRYVVIIFNSTNENYRHLRLTDIIFDTIVFQGTEIQNANIIEEISLTSLESPGNSLEFTLHSDDSDFSVVDPQGIYALLERRQKIDVTAFIDNVSEYMGRFYLQDWNSENDKLAKFQAIDALQILGIIPFADAGKLYYTETGIPGSHVTIQELVDDLETYTNFTYEVDASLQDIELTGVVPLGESVRSVLQNVAFAYGAYITCSRSSAVQIKAMELVDDLSAFDYVFDNSDLANRKITQIPLVTGIKLTSHAYQDNGDHVDYQIYNGNISLGFHRFLMPQDLLAFSTASSGTAVGTKDPQLLYADITVTAAGTLDWSVGQTKFHVRETLEQSIAGLPAGTPENIIEIENAYFVTQDNIGTVMQRLVMYFYQKHEMTAKVFASDVAVGESLDGETQKTGKRLAAIVEKTSINLVGLRTDLTAIGNITPYEIARYLAEYLVVAGGGSGGVNRAGGGGGGDVVHGTAILEVGETYNIVVGNGGVSVSSGSGNKGGDSSFGPYSAEGGGYGGYGGVGAAADGGDGGNGGGGGGSTGSTDGAGGSGNHNGGGGSNGPTNYGGGGGAGALENGYGGNSGLGTLTSDGGAGKPSSITGTSILYGGGGGGAGTTHNGSGGNGGGGNGNNGGNGINGTDYLGGGGGSAGSGYNSGAGGKGVVVLRVLTKYYSEDYAGSPVITIDGNYTVLKFEANGSYTA